MLPRLLAAYMVVAVGRIGDLSPWLHDIPLAKISIILVIVAALLEPKKTAVHTWKSALPAKLTMAFMGIVTLSMVFSVRHAATLGLILGTVLLVIITLVLSIRASRDWPSVKTMLRGSVAASIVLVIMAFSTRYFGRAGYIASLDPNDFAFVLVGLLPVVVTFGVVSRGARAYAHFTLAGLIIVAILLTESRGGLIGLIWDIAVMALLVPTARQGELQFHTPKSRIILRLLLLALIGAASWQLLPDSARARLTSITSLGSDYNTDVSAGGGRLAIWTRNLPLVIDRPWGYGAGSFDTVDGLYAGGRYRAPHNTFLQALIEVGIPGLVIYLAVIVSSIRYLRIRPTTPNPDKRAGSDEPRAFARALGIGLIALCITGFFLSQLYANVFWTFVILSCAVGIVRRNALGASDATVAGAHKGRTGWVTVRSIPTSRTERAGPQARWPNRY